MTRLTLSDISDNKFALAGLPLAKFIYADEEDAGQFVKKPGVFKSVITHEPVTIEGKFQNVFDFSFWVIIVQCLNDLPKFKDKTESSFWTLLFSTLLERACPVGLGGGGNKERGPDLLKNVGKSNQMD